MQIHFPSIDTFSFWLGFILSTLAWFILIMLRPAFRHMKEDAKEKKSTRKSKLRLRSAIEEHYRLFVYQHAQGQHLAAPLFSLDEIIEPPQLIAPPARVDPMDSFYTDDIVETTLPYLPTWPELASFYNAPTLTLAQALSGESDIVLVGQTGQGKTVALAHLASRVAKEDNETGLPEETLPFFVHVADIDFPFQAESPQNALVAVLSEKFPELDLRRLPNLINSSFNEGRALLLLDGTDEITPDRLADVIEFIKAVKRTYPKTRIVTTASVEYLDGLVSLNFIPFSLASWNASQRQSFLNRWGDLWSRYVSVETWAQISEQVDELLLNCWLDAESSNLTPLELTLKTWGTYAGDLSGPHVPDIIDSHIRRMLHDSIPREALESLAMQISIAAEPIFDPGKAREWVKSFETIETVPSSENEEEVNIKRKNGFTDKPKVISAGIILKIAETGLLTQHRNNRMRFAYPIFCGFLAGKALTQFKPDFLLTQPPWIGKFLAMHFLAAHCDVSPLVDSLLAEMDRPLSRNLIVTARWLRDAPRSASWRGKVMSKLVELLKQKGQPLGLRAQALAAMVRADDPSSAVVFRQLLDIDEVELHLLATLGVGATRDSKSVDLLATMLNYPSPNIRRAVCLALAGIGNTKAMDTLAYALLHGDEALRKYSAEAMANVPGEGHTMLREGAEMKEDLNVRNAVVYGLGRVNEPWADKILATLQMDDDQWMVRNSAGEIMGNRQKLDRHVPRRLPPPSESPWLISFASKQGVGISPDILPIDLLLLALSSGTDEEKLASLSYLRMSPTEGVFGALYHAMYGGQPHIREAVFQAFFEMASRGVEVPDPVQFGVGY